MRSLAPDVTEGPRSAILRCVSRFPGVHLRDIERRTSLPLGQVLYHLDRLERMGLVISSRDAGFRRYYLSRDVGRAEKKYLAALRHDVPRHLLVTLLERPGMSHKQLQEVLGVAGSTLSFHLQRLLTSGVVARGRSGSSNVYRVAEPHVARRELIYYRESFQDELVDHYVRRALETLPPLPEASPEPVTRSPPVAGPAPEAKPLPASS